MLWLGLTRGPTLAALLLQGNKESQREAHTCQGEDPRSPELHTPRSEEPLTLLASPRSDHTVGE